MIALLVTIHVLFAAIVIGALFIESLAMVVQRRLPHEEHREGARLLMARLHRGGYYPSLLIALITGAVLAWHQDVLSSGWLAWKLVLVVLLIGLGMIGGQALRKAALPRPASLIVHILIVFIAGGIVYLAYVKPF
jgi:uncharacterized membrane protein